MASFKLVLRTSKKKKDGTCPIAIRIIKDRKPHFSFTGKYILEKDWDPDACRVRKSHENSTRLNAFLKKKLSDMEGISGYFGEIDHLIPWQIDHQISWRPVAKNAVEALSKLVNKSITTGSRFRGPVFAFFS